MEYSFIDIHTHVNLEAFNNDFETIRLDARRNGVAYINVGTGRDTSERGVGLIEEGVWATVGVHPVRAGGMHDDDESGPEIRFDTDYYRTLASTEGVVAIGECGLDYFRVEKETKEMQEASFIAQINLANELKKPLMLHIRDQKGSMDAYTDALSLLKKYALVPGNVHFFAGNYDVARSFWDIGYSTSFTGVITFANEYDEVVKNAPLDMLHAETDAPYVAPIPYRGKRNEPSNVRVVYARIAALKNMDEEVVREALVKNAEMLFGLRLKDFNM